MTTAFDDIRAAFDGRIAAQWSATDILWANTYAKDGFTDNSLPDEFIMPEVIISSVQQITLGGVGDRLYRHFGFLWVHVFAKAGEGEGRINSLIDTLGGIFVGQEFSGVICSNMSPSRGEKGDDSGRYWRKSVRFDFEYDKVL